ncbi:MAG: lysophospholipid acyltransferase family protein [bacterium]|nr:lysophospholipid acyltransferase family protein [bacterium]
MQNEKIKIRHRIEYMFFMGFVLLLKILPMFLVTFNKKLLYFLGRAVSRKRFDVVMRNLTFAFPDNSEEENLKLREKIYRHFSSVFVEIIYLFVKKNKEKILKKIEVNNIEALEKALEKKRGVILFTAHFGNWELIPYILNRDLNTTLISIARKMDNPLIERVVKKFRAQMGSAIIYKQNSIRTILKKLEENRMVYLLIDQNTIEREAVFVDFFGKEVSAVPSVSHLHIKKGVPAIPLFLHYEKDKIVLDLYDEMQFTGTGNQQEDIRQLTQQCTTIIEENIKKYPEQWFWFHNRWKTRPKKETEKT